MSFNKKEWSKDYRKKHINTPSGRASNLISSYNEADKKANRDKGDLTAEWIVENIFAKPCAHCGKEGWRIIGCNRLDNSKPHTMDNVEPCCRSCNSKLQASEEDSIEGLKRASEKKKKKVYQIDLETKDVVNVFNSVAEAASLTNNCKGLIAMCCRGERNKTGGYAWKYKGDLIEK